MKTVSEENRKISSVDGKNDSRTDVSQVSLVWCQDYDAKRVYSAVEKAIGLLGGINSFIRKGDRVLIKPNLLSAKPPESAVDTHPEVTRAVIKLSKEAGATVKVGDSPGGSVKKMSKVLSISGTKSVCEEENAEIVNFDRIRMINNIPIALEALEVDVFISLPKFKTHSEMTLTGGVKNVFGIVPGLYKTECHKLAPRAPNLAKIIVDIYSYAKPHLTILDGIIGMEGEGPGSAGTPREINLIAASRDAVAIDALLARVMGLQPFDIPATKEACRRGLGNGRIENIQVVGESLERFIQEGFKLPKTTLYQRLPNWFLKFFARFIKLRPQVKPKLCTNCGICWTSCPVQAITSKKGRIWFDYDKCILCLCCHEFCPENAIFVQENAFAKIIRT